MSETIQVKKQERSKAKTSVTFASRRLINSADREVEFGVLKDLMDDLEKVYDEFWSVNEEFEELVSQKAYAEHRTVNGEDVIEYRLHVQRSYEDARDVFLQQKASNEALCKSQAAGPARIALKFDIRRMGEIVKAVNENLNTTNPNVEALKLDKQELQLMLDMTCKKTSELYVVESSKSVEDLQLQSEIEEVVGQVYSQVRTINLYLHERCLSTLNKEQLNFESTSSDLCENNSLLKGTPTNEPQHSPDTFTEGQAGCSNPPSTVIAPGNMNTTAPSFMPSTGMISENQIPSVSESQTSDASVNNITVDPSLNFHYFAETHPTSVSAVQVNTSTLPQYPTLWAPSFDPPQPGDPSPSLLVQNIPHQNPFNPCYQLDTGTTSHYCYEAVPRISSAITSCQSPNNSQSHLQSQKSVNTCLSTSMSPGIITSFPQPATRPCLFPNTINNHNLPTSAQHPSTVQPGSYVGNTHTLSLNMLLFPSPL